MWCYQIYLFFLFAGFKKKPEWILQKEFGRLSWISPVVSWSGRFPSRWLPLLASPASSSSSPTRATASPFEPSDAPTTLKGEKHTVWSQTQHEIHQHDLSWYVIEGTAEIINVTVKLLWYLETKTELWTTSDSLLWISTADTFKSTTGLGLGLRLGLNPISVLKSVCVWAEMEEAHQIPRCCSSGSISSPTVVTWAQWADCCRQIVWYRKPELSTHTHTQT